MIKTTIKILLAFHLVFLFSCFLQDQADASATTEAQEYIIERLNSIRSDPLAYAERLGYDRQALLETLPFLGEFIVKGVEPFLLNEFLNLKAVSLNSPRIPESDHKVLPENDYVYTGETKGTVSFLNFMGMETAIQIVIDNLFKKELDSKFEGQRYILSSNFDMTGVSCRGGVMWDRTGMKNSYIITICFGSSLLKSEVQVLNMINQLRAEPLKISNYFLSNLSGIFSENTDMIYAFFETYQPLFIDKILCKYGSVFNVDMDYLSQALYDGYNGVEVNQSSAVEKFLKTGSNSFPVSIFSSLISNELKIYPQKKLVFNPDFNDAGLTVVYVNGTVDDSATLTVTGGNRISEDAAFSKIYGIIYKDIDENGIYTPGEGSAKETVIIYDKEEPSEKVKTIITDNAGHFSVNLLNQKEYIIQTRAQTGTGETITEKDIYLDADQFFILKIMPIEFENLNM